jgi:hypothetical protein
MELRVGFSLSSTAQHPFHLAYPGEQASWNLCTDPQPRGHLRPPTSTTTSCRTTVQSFLTSSATSPVSPSEYCRQDSPRHLTSSSLLVVGRLADIFRDLSSAIRSKESLASRLECVKGFESRLDHLFDDFPELRPNDNEVYSSYIDPSKTFDWKPWSRFVWATAVSTCRIQLYRWLLCRSYAEGRFLEIREVGGLADASCSPSDLCSGSSAHACRTGGSGADHVPEELAHLGLNNTLRHRPRPGANARAARRSLATTTPLRSSGIHHTPPFERF